jgi:glycerol uptake facilitator-like aquaporin
MPSLFRRSLAEAFGTFALVFIGTGAVASKYFPDANYGILGIAVATRSSSQ